MSHVDLFYSLKEFLPKEYIKQRGAEKRIFQVCAVRHTTNVIMLLKYSVVWNLFICSVLNVNEAFVYEQSGL